MPVKRSATKKKVAKKEIRRPAKIQKRSVAAKKSNVTKSRFLKSKSAVKKAPSKPILKKEVKVPAKPLVDKKILANAETREKIEKVLSVKRIRKSSKKQVI